MGRYHNVAGGTDTTLWVGVVVDDERIDGIWKDGRWDLRRELPPEKNKD